MNEWILFITKRIKQIPIYRTAQANPDELKGDVLNGEFRKQH